LPFNLGITTAVPTGFEYALSNRATTPPCGSTATGSNISGKRALAPGYGGLDLRGRARAGAH